MLQLIEDPRMAPYLDEIQERVDKGMLRTFGQVGVLIGWMKKKLEE